MNNKKINNILKDPRTNWKYILIIAILAVIVGGVIWLLFLPIPLPWQPLPSGGCSKCQTKFVLWCEKCRSYGWSTELEETRLLPGETKQCLEKCFDIISPETASCGVMKKDCKEFGISEEEKEVLLTTDKTEYEIGEKVKITIKNNTEEEKVTIYGFYLVERFDDNQWQEVKRELCGCGSLMKCEVESPVLALNQIIEEEWNQKEEWCQDDKLISQQVPSGKYRLKSFIGNAERWKKGEMKEWEETIYSNEFTIKEKTEETECEKWLNECAKEGESKCSACGCRYCCPGLVSRDVTHPYRSENNEVVCLENMTAYICVKCGDRICDKDEDWCICPEDCPKPSPEDL